MIITTRNEPTMRSPTSQWPEHYWHSFICLNKNNLGKARSWPHPILKSSACNLHGLTFWNVLRKIFFFFYLWSANEYLSTFRTYNSNFSLRYMFRKNLVNTKYRGILTMLCLFPFETDLLINHMLKRHCQLGDEQHIKTRSKLAGTPTSH